MKDAKQPNLTGPRYRQSVSGTINADMVREIKEKVPAAKDYTDQQIKDMLRAFNENVWKTALDNRDGVELPEQIGHIFIGTCPPKKSPNVDFKMTKEYLKVIQHRNWESDNYLAKIFFTNYSSKYRFKNHEIWGFNAARQFTRTLGQVYPKQWKMYIQVDPKRKISVLYRKQVYKQIKQSETQDMLKNYNEFEL